MKFPIFNSMMSVLIIPGLMIIQLGCAKKSPQQDTLKEYREMSERQRAASEREEKEALKKIPEMTAEGHEKLGDSYVRQGNFDMAFIQYDKALGLDPKRIEIRYKIGRLFLEKGVIEEAKKEFQEILKTHPNHALSHEGMGRVYIKSGEFDEAEKSFLKAIRLDSNLWQGANFPGILFDYKKN